MGRTLPPFKSALESELRAWNSYHRLLSPEDRDAFDRIVAYARMHADAGANASRDSLTEVILLSAILELEKKVERLTRELAAIKKQNGSEPEKA